MAPWSSSSRFNSTTPTSGTNTSSSQPAPPPSTGRKPLPRTPLQSPPGPVSPTRIAFVQQNGQPSIPSPTRPTSSGGERHSHSRSMSNPLPKFFGRKRSHPALQLPADLPPDDALVPVLESPVATSNTPMRLMSGKKKDDDRNMATRQCMCCDSKVRFPRDLNVFRCTSCMTVNDLEPYRPKPRDGDRPHGRQLEGRQHTLAVPQQSARVVPLSVERSRAIIDRCLLNYLEARCRRQATTSSKPLPPDPFVNGGSVTTPSSSSRQRQPSPGVSNSQPADILARTPSATLKTSADFDWLPKNPSLVNCPSPTKPSPSSNSLKSPPRKNQVPSIPPLPALPGRRPPPPPAQTSVNASARPAYNPTSSPPSLPAHRSDKPSAQTDYERVKVIFKPLEEYLLATYGDFECLNSSFCTVRPHTSARARSESAIRTPPPEPVQGAWPSPIDSLQNLDAKTLMIGDFAENGQWWTGRVARKRSDKDNGRSGERKRLTTSKTPHVNWDELIGFYDIVRMAGSKWWEKLDQLKSYDEETIHRHIKGPKNAREIDDDLSEARQHAERALLKITETLLKRPTQQLTEPDHVRFLLLILMNPSLYPDTARTRVHAGKPGLARVPSHPPRSALDPTDARLHSPPKRPFPSPTTMQPMRAPEQHTGIRKRIFGLMANSSDSCHRSLIGWFSRLPEARFMKIVDLVASFVTHRLLRRRPRTRSQTMPQDGGLIPDLSGSARNTSAQLRSATGLGGSVRVKDMEPTQNIVDYSEDWQLKAAAKVMALLFAANNSWQPRKAGLTPAETNMTSLSRPRAKTHGQLLPTSDYYNTLLDYNDLVADFKAWEQKKGKFTFCQFPFFLSMGAKIRVLEYDARRQMELKAREAYFDSVTKNRAIDGYLHLRVRRDCMVDDSLQQISAAVGQGQEELKKGLKVHFTDEEGVDAGGLRKEWFLMIVRDIFDPNHGMFLYDDDSQTCYFNPNSFETSDQYYLVGALLGLAIYNSTILDVAFPPFAFRKLLAAAPPSSSNPSLPTAGARAQMTYTVDDLAEYRPALAAGLRQLLEFDGDVQGTFCRDFVAPVERYGIVTEVPLCANGENKPVTNANRQEFVDLYIRYLLDVSVARQFEPFKRGFFTVCAGNALSLFRPEEIELLVRGSDEALDVDSLRAVAVYENWRSTSPPHKALPCPAETVPVIGWFWDFFKKSTPEHQRLLLGFITGSDRIPAVGATNLVLRICCGGDGLGWDGSSGVDGASAGTGAGSGSSSSLSVLGGPSPAVTHQQDRNRFPIARTCFNMLVLWGYESREKLEERLWRAVCESEGFGLK